MPFGAGKLEETSVLTVPAVLRLACRLSSGWDLVCDSLS